MIKVFNQSGTCDAIRSLTANKVSVSVAPKHLRQSGPDVAKCLPGEDFFSNDLAR